MRGFPHSEIPGSKLICSSPRLIAACHVLLRLLMPRHSPYALFRLNFLYSLVLLNCLSFLNKIIFFALKRFFPFRVVYPPFGEIVSHLLMHYPFWKDSINFSIFVLFNLFVSLTHSSKFKFEFFRLPIRLSSFMRRTLCGWSVWMDSNHRPRAYQARALATWATDRYFTHGLIGSSIVLTCGFPISIPFLSPS